MEVEAQGTEAPASEQTEATQPSAETKNADNATFAPVPFARFKEVNDELAKLRQEASEAAKAKKDADDKALADRQEWEKLAKSRESELEKLQPKLVLADKVIKLIEQQLDTEIKSWPESVRKIMPKADASLEERLDWVERTRPLAEELIDATNKNRPIRFPTQHSSVTQPETTKDTALGVLKNSYPRPKSG